MQCFLVTSFLYLLCRQWPSKQSQCCESVGVNLSATNKGIGRGNTSVFFLNMAVEFVTLLSVKFLMMSAGNDDFFFCLNGVVSRNISIDCNMLGVCLQGVM